MELVGRLIVENPDYGLRRLTVLVRRELGAAVNRKRIHRILKANGWQIRQRPRGQRPRAQGWVSRVARPNVRWAIDATHVFCGQDRCHLTAIVDCCDRTLADWRPVAVRRDANRGGGPRGRAPGSADRVWPHAAYPSVLDNGLVFAAKVFVNAVRRYGLDQEYIIPYSPEQNGRIERFFRTLKGRCRTSLCCGPARSPTPK